MRDLRCRGIAGLLWACAAAAQAMSFGEAVDAARRFDAQYRAAAFELQSARQSLPIAKASLMPNVTLTASGTNASGSREFPNSLDQQVRVPLDYNAPQANLQLRTPIFNYEALTRYRQAGAQVDSAESVYEARGLDLVERTAAAYLQAVLANETVDLAEAERRSLGAQGERAQQRQLHGEGTRTEVAQTQAAVDVAEVRLIEAQDQLDIALRALRRITGVQTARLKGLGAEAEPVPLEPRLLSDWLELAERQNPSLRARRQDIQVASLNIDRNRAAHLPRLDLVAGVSRSRNESISSLEQVSTLKSVGVQLSVPLYSGGGIEASVAQALAERARTEEALRVEREGLQIEIQRQHAIVTNARTKIDAYRRALASSDVALEGVTKALAAGLSTTADVLDAQTRRHAARRDLAQARIDVLGARMRLLMLAGTPLAQVVSDLDASLVADSALKIRTQP